MPPATLFYVQTAGHAVRTTAHQCGWKRPAFKAHGAAAVRALFVPGDKIMVASMAVDFGHWASGNQIPPLKRGLFDIHFNRGDAEPAEDLFNFLLSAERAESKNQPPLGASTCYSR